MAKMTRQQIEDTVKRGEHVAVGPFVLRRDPTTLRPEPAALDAALATPPDKKRPDEFEAVVVRGTDGKLNRAGMEHAIRHGGSVMLGGVIVTRLEDLPDEVALAEGDRQRLQSHRDALDVQLAGLAEQRRQADEAMKRAEREAPKAEAQESPAESESQRRQRVEQGIEDRDRQEAARRQQEEQEQRRQAAESERQRQQAEAEQQAQRKKK